MKLSIFGLVLLVVVGGVEDAGAKTGSQAENLIVPDEDERVLNSGFLNQLQDGLHKKTKLSNRPIFVIISYDGFRFDYFSKGRTPYLDWVKEKGVSAPYMKPQYPTKTFPNHHSIATGLHPESHGIIDNKFFDPLYNTTLRVSDEKFWVYDSNVVPLWVLNELDGGVSGVMMWPGSSFAYGSNETKATYIYDWNNTVPYESRVDTVVSWLTNETNPANLVFMYFEEPDENGHGFGPDSQEVKNTIERMDNVTGYFLEKLRDLDILDNVNLLFLSDHGFEEVKQTQITNISDIVNPKKYEVFGGSPNLHIIPNSDEDLESLYEEFKRGSEGRNFSVYKKETIKQEKPHWFFSESRRIMPILLVADLGYVFEDFFDKMQYYDRKFNVSHTSSRVYGNHGYDNHFIHMQAFFRAAGPAFRAGVEIDPFENIDLFPLLCQLLKIPTPPNNGTMLKIETFLFRQGFQMGAPVGWIIGGAVVIGGLILIFIFSILLKHRRKARSFAKDGSSSAVGYRCVKSEGDFEWGEARGLDDNRNGVLVTFRRGRSGEGRSLLKSNSEDSMSSTESQTL